MQGIGRIDGNRITDLFMEFNGSNITGNIIDMPFAIEKVISFVTPENLEEITIQNYANVAFPDIAEIKGFTLGVGLKDQNLTVRPSIQEITTSCLLYTSPSPRDRTRSRMPSSA